MMQTPEKRSAILATIEELRAGNQMPTIALVADRNDIGRNTFYALMRADDEIDAAFQKAKRSIQESKANEIVKAWRALESENGSASLFALEKKIGLSREMMRLLLRKFQPEFYKANVKNKKGGRRPGSSRPARERKPKFVPLYQTLGARIYTLRVKRRMLWRSAASECGVSIQTAQAMARAYAAAEKKPITVQQLRNAGIPVPARS